MFNLSRLLGLQQSSSSVPEALGDEILVTGSPIAPSAPDPLQDDFPSPINNGKYIINRDEAFADSEEAVDPNRSDRTGLFGAKGTLRDVLGTVGDAFLVQSGNKPMYAPRREKERLADAMAGFTENPMEAIERVAGINPEAANAMLQQYQLNQYRTSQTSTANRRATTDATREARMGREQAMDYVSQAYAAAIASGDPAAMSKALELAQSVSAQTGMSLAELGVSEDMTNVEAGVLAGRGATVNQNLRLPQQERALQIREDQERGRNRRNSQNETGRNRRAREAEEGRNRRSREAEEGRNRRSNNRSDRRDGSQRRLRGNDDSPTESRRFY